MMDIYIEPADERTVEKGDLNLTWNLTKIQSTMLTMRLKFDDPVEISSIEIQDSLVIHFKPEATFYLHSKSLYEDTIHPRYTTLKQKIRK